MPLDHDPLSPAWREDPYPVYAEWEPRARQIVKECMRAFEGVGRADVVDDLATPLPVTLIAEMLGVELDRRVEFKQWSDSIIALASGAAGENPLESGVLDTLGGSYDISRTPSGLAVATRETI